MIKGLKEFEKSLKEAQRVLESLDGELTVVQFSPDDPASIEAAIQQVEQVIDEKVGEHSSNSFIAPLAEQMKAQYRDAIIERAAAARLEEDE